MAKKRVNVPKAAEIEVETFRLDKALQKKKKTLEELQRVSAMEAEFLDSGVEALDDAPSKIPGSAKIERIMGELGGEGSFDVYRMDAQGKASKLATYDVDLYPEALEKLVASRGGGDYILKFRNPDGSPAGQVSRTFDQSSYPQAGGSGSSDATVLRLMEIMDQKEARSAQAVESMRLENQRLMMEMQKTMLEVMKSQTASADAGLERMLKMRELLKDEKPDMVEQFLQFKDLMGELKNEASEEPPLVRAVEKITEALAGAALSRGNRASGAGALPGPVSPLEKYAKSFETAIKSGGAAIASAEKTFEVLVSSGAWEEFKIELPALRADAAWLSLYNGHPFLAANRGWCEQFRETLMGKIADRLNAENANHTEPVSVPGSSGQDQPD